VLELLLNGGKAGVNVNMRENEGLTPLLHAIVGNHIEAVKLLSRHGAYPSIPGNTLY
jgi:ankyrin repeat protein